MSVLEIKNLAYAHLKGQLLFYDINVNLNSGVVFLLGEKGAGKTTLLELISGMREGYFGDIKILEKSPKESSKNISFLPSNIVAFNKKSVLKNLQYACDAINISYDKINMTDPWICKYKSIKINKLSAYNKAIFALKRAELKQAQILLLDINLNSFTDEDIKNYGDYLKLICKNAKNRLIIISIDANCYKKLQIKDIDAYYYYLFGNIYKYTSLIDYNQSLLFKGMADYLGYTKKTAKISSTNNGYILIVGNLSIKLKDIYVSNIESYFTTTNEVEIYIFYNCDLFKLSDSDFNLKLDSGEILLFDSLSTERLN